MIADRGDHHVMPDGDPDPIMAPFLVHVAVHLPGQLGTVCRSGVVLTWSPEYPALHLRVLNPTPVGFVVGEQDAEGWYQPWTNPTRVPSPDGTVRELDTWHHPGPACQSDERSPADRPPRPLTARGSTHVSCPAWDTLRDCA